MSKSKPKRKHEFYVTCQNCESIYPLLSNPHSLVCLRCSGKIIKINHRDNLQKTLTFSCGDCADKIYFNTNQYRPCFHNCHQNIRCYNLKFITSYKYKENYTFKQKSNSQEIIGIIQPGKIGDIIISLPIAQYYKNKGYKIVWAACSQFTEYFDYVDYIDEIIDLGHDRFHAYNKAQVLLDGYYHHIIDLGFAMWSNGVEWVSSGKSFDRVQYDEARLPIEVKYNLSIKRKKDKELRLKNFLALNNKEYIITHSQGTKDKKYDFGIPDAIEIRPIEGFTLFDWIGILEEAKEIYCIDSSIANLVNQLGIAKGRRYFRPLYEVYKKSVGQECLMPHLADGWKIL